MILVLGTGGLLKLPKTGYQLYMRPEDAVFFLANQQLHKLEVDSGAPNAVQTVFTLWTAKPSQYDDFHTVEPDAEDETDADEADMRTGGEDDGHRLGREDGCIFIISSCYLLRSG
jgi:hypothetical protein